MIRDEWSIVYQIFRIDAAPSTFGKATRCCAGMFSATRCAKASRSSHPPPSLLRII